ncbi:dihydroneopterin aldolase [Nitratifractor sp.]
MTIEIDDLSFEAILGILPREREIPQPLRVNLRAEYRYLPEEYLDYAAIAEQVKSTLQKGRFGLIEDALSSLGGELLASYPQIETLTIRIEKPEILPDCRVAVEESWRRV